MNWWKKRILRGFRSAGYDLTRYRPSTHAESRRMHLFKTYQVDLVLDVGANTGQYALELREAGFLGKIVSFEPMKGEFETLKSAAANDRSWKIFNCALGSDSSTKTIFVAGNSASSSLLKMLPAHEAAAPESKYIGNQLIEVKKLDDVFESLATNATFVWLKIDTQGYEAEVIKGAAKSLSKIGVVQIEVSLTPLYDGAPTLSEILLNMEAHGYSPIGIDPGFCDEKTGHLLQVDVTFQRESKSSIQTLAE